MKGWDLIVLAFQNLYGNKMRSSLTILGVGVGIGAIIFLVGLGFGIQRLTVNQLTTSAAITSLEIYSGNPDILKIDENVVSRLKNLPQIERVSSISHLPGQASFEAITTESLVRVIDIDYYSLAQQKFLAGNWSEEPGKAVVSSGLLKLFDIEDFKQFIGKKLTVSVFSLTLENGPTENPSLEIEAVGVIEEPAQLVEVSRSDAQAFKLTDYSRVKAKVKNVEDIQAVQKTIADWGFNVTSLADKLKEINRIFRIFQFALAGFGLIALVVAAIGMFNTMTVTLLERTREIGVMRALGARRKDVRRLFILEAGLIGFSGGGVGIILAWILVLLVNAGVNILAKSAGQETITIYYFPLMFLAGVLIFSLLVGLSTGIYPALRASRLNPLDALKYE